jgi:ABC-type Fe3+/spermidine/putrescine transport system ATPase subunit
VTDWSVEGIESDLDRFHLGPVDLALAAGRVTAVVGPSGAGKTTLLRTIAGFLPARRGRILRGGVDLTLAPPEERRLGYVPQGLGLFAHRTVERNVSYPFEIRGRLDWRARTRELLERFGLAPLADRRPALLSGGELQRVALARALAAEPDLVLWDEPWHALDVEARHELGIVFEELRADGGIPVVVVTHDPGLAFSVADSFLELREGSVRRISDAPALLADPQDAFAARFVGFENVFDRSALAGPGAGALGRWLADRAGPGGVAFARPLIVAGPGAPGAWSAVVRGVHPTPEGFAITADAGGLRVALRLPPPFPATVPALGATVTFDVPAESLRALG